MSKNYTVQIGDEFSPTSSTISGLTQTQAVAEARKACNDNGQSVYVYFYRASDGQTVYLNADGSHDITGRNWN